MGAEKFFDAIRRFESISSKWAEFVFTKSFLAGDVIGWKPGAEDVRLSTMLEF